MYKSIRRWHCFSHFKWKEHSIEEQLNNCSRLNGCAEIQLEAGICKLSYSQPGQDNTTETEAFLHLPCSLYIQIKRWTGSGSWMGRRKSPRTAKRAGRRAEKPSGRYLANTRHRPSAVARHHTSTGSTSRVRRSVRLSAANGHLELAQLTGAVFV